MTSSWGHIPTPLHCSSGSRTVCLPFHLENIFFIRVRLSYLHKLFNTEFYGGKVKIYSFCFTADFCGQECLLLSYFICNSIVPGNPNSHCCFSNINDFEWNTKFKWNLNLVTHNFRKITIASNKAIFFLSICLLVLHFFLLSKIIFFVSQAYVIFYE